MDILPIVFFLTFSIYCSLAQNCELPYSNTFFINSSSYIDIVDSNMQFIQKSIARTPHQAWTASIPNAEWIWSNNIRDFSSASILNFGIEIQINSLLSSAIIKVAADNSASVFVNNYNVESCKTFDFSIATSCNVLMHLVIGVNSFRFEATDAGGDAGLIFSIALYKN